MSREIIIDGVNVAECEFFSCMSNGEPATICSCYKDMYGFDTDCKYNEASKNCSYKQLKRLQAENERLDNEAQDYHNTIMKLNDLVKELKADNELIKRLLNDILRIFNLGQYDFLKDQNEIIMALEKAVQKDKDFYEFTELSAENERLKAKLNEWEKELQSNEKIINRLIKENEELKELNIEYDEDLSIEKESHKSDIETLDKYRKALEEIREYASAIEKEELIAGYAIRAKSALWRIVKKISEVLDER